jgi:hypothetical protein
MKELSDDLFHMCRGYKLRKRLYPALGSPKMKENSQ